MVDRAGPDADAAAGGVITKPMMTARTTTPIPGVPDWAAMHTPSVQWILSATAGRPLLPRDLVARLAADLAEAERLATLDD